MNIDTFEMSSLESRPVVVAYIVCKAEGASGVNLAHSLIMIYILCLIDVIHYL